MKPRYYYNTESNRCEEFLYGGCRGNENNFEMLVDCVSTCGKQLRSRFPPLPPPLPKCKFGNESYAIGDIVRLDSDPCKVTRNALLKTISTVPTPQLLNSWNHIKILLEGATIDIDVFQNFSKCRGGVVIFDDLRKKNKINWTSCFLLFDTFNPKIHLFHQIQQIKPQHNYLLKKKYFLMDGG